LLKNLVSAALLQHRNVYAVTLLLFSLGYFLDESKHSLRSLEGNYPSSKNIKFPRGNSQTDSSET